MNRRPFPLRSLAAVDSAAVMSYRPNFRGGRSQFGRGYCGRPVGPATGDRPEFVSGDSHFGAVRDANRGFRPSYNAVPPPPQLYNTQPYNAQPLHRPGPRFQRPGPPVMQAEQHPGPRPYMRPPQRPGLGSISGNHQQFSPRPMQQQFRPRATKPPDYREWEYRKMELPPHCERFTVLSYNILADYLAIDHRQQLYYHIPGYIMDWNWRKKNIVFELGLWSADILCFQEVDRFQDIEAELKPRGYSGIWKMRTGNPVDGCAIFWRDSRFKLVYEESIEYSKHGLRDNVAQICVFESRSGQNNSNGASTQPTSSVNSNRVVICNIHVLFNPKRGDIKLGQIRILLEKANAVSKLWDNAPVVLCGDFNCTPESPMYNFIKKKELDLSELARDKVSGQASGELGSPRSAYTNFRAAGANKFTQAIAVGSEQVLQGDLLLDAHKSAIPHLSNAPSVGSYSQPGSSVFVENTSPSSTEEHRSREVGDLNQTVGKVQVDIQSPILSDTGADVISTLESCSKDIHSEAAKGGENEKEILQTVSDTQIKHSDHISKTSTYKDPSDSPADDNLSKHVADAITVSASIRNNETSGLSASGKCTSSDSILDQKFEALSLDEVFDDTTPEAAEDSESFLSELHSGDQSLSSPYRVSSPPNQKLDYQGVNQNLRQESMFNMQNFRYNPSAWTPAEIETATGSADCKVMEHPLKLTSAYTEVESSSELRDSSGEPFVTSYHKRFLGTVDYIWHSQGLETVKVLAPIAKHVMHQSRGFPTKKWGSDHIALVSEFAFTKDIPSETPKQ